MGPNGKLALVLKNISTLVSPLFLAPHLNSSELDEIKFCLRLLLAHTEMPELPRARSARAAFRLVQLLKNDDSGPSKKLIEEAHNLLRDEDTPASSEIQHDGNYDNRLFYATQDEARFSDYVNAGLDRYFTKPNMPYFQMLINRITYYLRNFNYPEDWAREFERILTYTNNEEVNKHIENCLNIFFSQLHPNDFVQLLLLVNIVRCDSDPRMSVGLSGQYANLVYCQLLLSIAPKHPKEDRGTQDLVINQLHQFLQTLDSDSFEFKFFLPIFLRIRVKKLRSEDTDTLSAMQQEIRLIVSSLTYQAKTEAPGKGIFNGESGAIITYANAIASAMRLENAALALLLLQEMQQKFGAKLTKITGWDLSYQGLQEKYFPSTQGNFTVSRNLRAHYAADDLSVLPIISFSLRSDLQSLLTCFDDALKASKLDAQCFINTGVSEDIIYYGTLTNPAYFLKLTIKYQDGKYLPAVYIQFNLVSFSKDEVSEIFAFVINALSTFQDMLLVESFKERMALPKINAVLAALSSFQELPASFATRIPGLQIPIQAFQELKTHCEQPMLHEDLINLDLHNTLVNLEALLAFHDQVDLSRWQTKRDEPFPEIVEPPKKEESSSPKSPRLFGIPASAPKADVEELIPPTPSSPTVEKGF